jgi:hypothetical protein
MFGKAIHFPAALGRGYSLVRGCKAFLLAVFDSERNVPHSRSVSPQFERPGRNPLKTRRCSSDPVVLVVLP